MADPSGSTGVEEMKLALLRRRLAAAGVQGTRSSVPAETSDELSFGQRRLWFLDRFSPGLAIYNIPAAVRIRGPLNAAILQSAFEAVVRRHEILRTVFSSADGRPRQQVEPPAAFHLQEYDLRDVDAASRDEEARRRASILAAEPFDLTTGPLLRAALYRTAEDESLLAVVAHHIVSDGASTELLIHEVTTISLALALGQPAGLPPLSCQYAAYAAWQHAQFASGALGAQLAYWRRALEGMPGVLGLPTDRAREPMRHAGAKLEYPLPGVRHDQVAALAAAHDTTPFTVLLAAFNALLARYAGSSDIVIGTPVNHRPLAEFEPLIGFFVNTLVLRTRLDGNPSFADLVDRTRRTSVDAMANRDVPFELLVQELNPTRLLSQNPLVQVMFSYQPEPPERAAARGVSIEPVSIHLPLAKLDLSVYVTRRGDELIAIAEYDTGLFAEASAERLMRHFARLLQNALRDPSIPVSLLDWLTPDERPILRGAPARASETIGSTIHAAVAAQARATPNAPAVIEGGQVLTYAGLEQRALALSRVLASRGIGPGDRVAIAVAPSSHLIVAALGVLTAGAAYVPLDPRQPAARVARMLDAAGVSLCLTTRDTVHGLPADARVVNLDALDAIDAIDSDCAGAASCPVTGADVAYVIFTSGTTGTPKGVIVEHRAVLNLVRSIGETARVAPGERLLTLTTPGFDIAALEWFLPLVTGGSVIVAPPGTSRDGAAIAALLAEERITMLQATPATWRLLVECGWPGTPGLKALCGGEALPLDLARDLTARTAAVWNVYGPTETTIWSMVWRVPPDAGPVLLGDAVAGTHVAVLGADGALVPPGAEGELHIGGIGVARGYIGAPDATAARFTPDPLAARTGARWYRTGDRVRWQADRSIQFLGRGDGQLKIRGFRVEPGEIEAALMRHPAVRQAAVVLMPDAAGARLAAMVLAGDPPPAAEELRGWLRGQLPEYMVPGHVSFVTGFPLTASGKIDRRALSVSGADSPAPRGDTTPVTEHEELLAAIYAEVLQRPVVDVTASFFDLGGHSLLAARVVARARTVLGVDVPLRAIFESPSVRELAAHVAVVERRVFQTPIPRRSAGAAAPTLLSFAQERLYFIDRLGDDRAAPNLVLAARVHDRFDDGLLARCLDELARRHEVLRTSFAEVDGTPRALAGAPVSIPLTVSDASSLDEPHRRAYVEAAVRRQAALRFDLGRAPLMRAELIHESDRTSVLVLALHHLVADGPSIEILTRELASLYRSASAGEPFALPRAGVQYADFASWQRAELTRDALGEGLAFWRQSVEGAALSLDFVTDYAPGRSHDNPDDAPVDASAVRIELPPDTAQAVRDFARRHHATLFMTLLASWQAYLARWTATDDFLVGTPVANRPRPELDGVVGMFANTIVLRADLRSDPSFTEILARVRRRHLDALAHQDVPFELLVETLAPPRRLDRTPLFQTMFTLQHEERQGTADRTESWEPLRIETGASRFDVSLAVSESHGSLAATFEFRSDLFARSSIEAAAAQWAQLLDSAIAAPALPLSRLAAGSPARGADAAHTVEWHSWLGGASHATAIVSEAGALTFRQLAARVDRFARVLQDAGVGHGALVPIAAERTADTIALMLAAWRCGAGYVPVAADAPGPRVRQLLDVVGREDVWRGGDVSTAPGGAARESAGEPEAPAYVIFTSGSTGAPKGVVVPSRAVSHYVRAARARFALDVSDRVLQFASLAFDTSVEEIFPTLAAGAALVLASAEVYESVEALADFCEQHGVTVLDLPTAYWHQMVARLKEARVRMPEAVRLVIIGGEEARRDCVADWASLVPHVALVNTYGPTEATVVCTAWTMDAEAGIGRAARVPIGDALPGVHVRVVGRGLEPCPAGLPGELVIGGDGVAQGYLGEPALTADRFVPDPFASRPGARMYRTGDRARITATGVLEFLGRMDRQLKIRGFRVEPAEVEVALCQHPAVARCAVAAGRDGQGAAQLVACVVAARDARPTPSELRDYLRGRLPAYSVPARIAIVDAIPTTTTGKLDESAVLALADANGRSRGGDTGDSLVDLLRSIWSTTLGVEARADDSFFDLGGHSLMLLRLTADVRTAIGAEVSLRAVFEAPTPIAFAAWLRTAGGRRPALPRIPATDRTAAPLTVSQERIFGVQRQLPAATFYNVNVAVRLDVELDPRVLVEALNDVAVRHLVLASRVVAGQPWPELVGSETALDVDFFDLSGLGPQGAEAAARNLAGRLRRLPFDLENEPPIRVWLARLAPAGSALLISVHHIVADGVSTEILLGELAERCRARSLDEAPDVTPLGPTFFDVAAWERQALAEGRFDESRAFWLERLRPPAAPLLLPGAGEASRLEHLGVAREHRLLPADAASALFARAARRQATPFMAVMAVLNAAVAGLTGNSDVRLATMTANRGQAGTAPIIGLLTNTLVLRLALDDAATFDQLLGQVRRVVLDASDHQEIPFEVVLQSLEAERPIDRAMLAPFLVLWQYDRPETVDETAWGARPLFSREGAPRPDLMATGFDLVWEWQAGDDGLQSTLLYRTDRYDADAVRPLMDRFERLARAAANGGEEAWTAW